MKCLAFILLFAASVSASGYGVLGLCSTVRGVEHCTLVEGDYRSLTFGNVLVVAAGFDISRYELSGDAHLIVNANGSKVSYHDATDEHGYRYMVFESLDNLWISDSDGCFMMKYLTGGPDAFRRRYAFTELNDPAPLVGFINECRTKKDTK